MAEIIWTEPAIASLAGIADVIALDNPEAAKRLVRRILESVDNLQNFPLLGPVVPEMPNFSHRQLVVPPCRIFYRLEGDHVFVVFVMRGERQFYAGFLGPTER